MLRMYSRGTHFISIFLMWHVVCLFLLLIIANYSLSFSSLLLFPIQLWDFTGQ